MPPTLRSSTRRLLPTRRRRRLRNRSERLLRRLREAPPHGRAAAGGFVALTPNIRTPARLQPGAPAAVADAATFEKPHAFAAGVPYVLVNGVVVIRKGEHTNTFPGVVLTAGATPK